LFTILYLILQTRAFGIIKRDEFTGGCRGERRDGYEPERFVPKGADENFNF